MPPELSVDVRAWIAYHLQLRESQEAILIAMVYGLSLGESQEGICEKLY